MIKGTSSKAFLHSKRKATSIFGGWRQMKTMMLVPLMWKKRWRFFHMSKIKTQARVTQVQQDNEVPVLRGACGILDELCLCQIGETRSFTPSEGKSMNMYVFLRGRFHSWQQFNNLSWKNETSNSCICLLYIFSIGSIAHRFPAICYVSFPLSVFRRHFTFEITALGSGWPLAGDFPNW